MKQHSLPTGTADAVPPVPPVRRPTTIARARARTRPRRWPLVAVRVLALLFTAGVLAQAALAGQFVTGDVNLLEVHGALGTALILLPMLALPAALALWWFGRGPLWCVAIPVALLALVGMQIGVGFSRNLAWHIPLGTGLLGMSVGHLVWAFGYRRHLTDDAPSTDSPSALLVPAAPEEATR
ncbi:hypothetical protein ACWEPM_36740 [Streptomyces sp. NPDC004244]